MQQSIRIPGITALRQYFTPGGISSTSFFNNIVQYTSPAGGYEALIRMDGGQQVNDSFYNNVFDENNSSSGQSCDCAVFKLTSNFTSNGTRSGLSVENNIFTNIASGVFLNEDGTLPGKFGNRLDR